MRLTYLLVTLASLAACGDDGASTAPIKLQRLPLDLGAIDYSALLAHHDKYQDPPIGFPLGDFGYFTPPFPNAPQGKTAPQLGFWAPLETDVLAPITGTVLAVGQLYSGDFGIMFEGNDFIWEVEHVIDVNVAVGDTVDAGQVVAKVSDYECEYAKREFGNDALCGIDVGIVEFGLLFGGETAQHGCPFEAEYMAPEAAASIEAELAAARAEIETTLGNQSYYDQASWDSPNCIKTGLIGG